MPGPAQESSTLRSSESCTALRAEDVMTPNPRTCSNFSTVLEAVLIFRDADCGVVPVLDDGKPVGVLTDRDVALALAHYPDLASRTVDEIRSKGVISVPPDATIDAVKEKFGDKSVRRLLVIDANGQLRGIISWADIAAHLSDRSVGEVVSEVVQQPIAR
jgi:CBS domain-containing protein